MDFVAQASACGIAVARLLFLVLPLPVLNKGTQAEQVAEKYAQVSLKSKRDPSLRSG
jgi:hypothetical protein